MVYVFAIDTFYLAETRDGVYIMNITTRKIAGRSVMDSMAFAPLEIWGECEDAAELTQTIICFARGEKGTVPAVMLDNKYADQHARGRQGESEGYPIAHIEAQVH